MRPQQYRIQHYPLWERFFIEASVAGVWVPILGWHPTLEDAENTLRAWRRGLSDTVYTSEGQ